VRSPLFYFNFFLFLRGNLSDNLGRLFGLRGIFSLFPLLAGAGLLAAALGRISSRPRTRPEKRGNALRAAALGSMIILWVVSAGWEEPFLREVDKAESLFRYYRGRREVDWTEVEEYYQRAIEYEPRLIEPSPGCAAGPGWPWPITGNWPRSTRNQPRSSWRWPWSTTSWEIPPRRKTFS